MRKLNLFKYGLTALMMAFAMTLCFSCSSDDDEETPGEKKESKEEQKDTFKGDGKINGHDYVVLAGIKWATENVGAVSGVQAKAADATYGYYYTQDNARKAVASWGGTWRLPSEAQCQALLDECNWEWIYSYSFGGKTMNGYKVSDKNDDTKFIFLPAAAIYFEALSHNFGRGHDGCYWSTGNGRYLYFGGGDRIMNYYNPFDGMAVRPVSD